MRKLALTPLLAMALWSFGAQTVLAIAQFQAVFIKEYITDHPDKEFADYVKKKAKCNICHQGKVSPKNVHHNVYGTPLVEMLDPEKDKKDVEKIKKALAEVAAMPSDPKDEKSPTFGDLIKQSKLPGGPLEESQKEPEGESAEQ
ncbi:MAG: hypothetical protein DCC67_19195 [Planctomycetota bacterium]|nr:MAG: hypothetical protein DCC67_19195 [Planctomycetota bacterium]